MFYPYFFDMEPTKKKMTFYLDYVSVTIIPTCLVKVYDIFESIVFNFAFVYDYSIWFNLTIFFQK